MLHLFDTHRIVKSFVKSGLKNDQAEVIVNAIAESREYDLSNLATKIDLVEVDNRLTAEINRVENHLTAEIKRVETTLTVRINEVEKTFLIELEKTKAELLKWFIGSSFVSLSLMITFLKFFN